MTNHWSPGIDRGDGIWIGLVDGRSLGVGARDELKAMVDEENLVALWPLLENDPGTTVAKIIEHWDRLAGGQFENPESLIVTIVSSALKGRQIYWIEHAIHWLSYMAQSRRFSATILSRLVEGVAGLDAMPQAVRHDVERIKRLLTPKQ